MIDASKRDSNPFVYAVLNCSITGASWLILEYSKLTGFASAVPVLMGANDRTARYSSGELGEVHTLPLKTLEHDELGFFSVVLEFPIRLRKILDSERRAEIWLLRETAGV